MLMASSFTAPNVQSKIQGFIEGDGLPVAGQVHSMGVLLDSALPLDSQLTVVMSLHNPN